MKEKMRIWTIAGLILGVALSAASGALMNESFETPAVEGAQSPAGTVPDNWNAEGTLGNLYLDREDLWSPFPDGLQFVQLGPDLTLWQNTGLIMQEGVTYTLSFEATTYDNWITDNVLAYMYAADASDQKGSLIESFADHVDNTASPSYHYWKHEDFSYVCDATNAGKYLTVAFGGTANWSGYDKVVLVPEPLTVGFLALGLIAQRRRA